MRPGWVRTYSGSYVSLLAPDPETIFLPDIAHHLSVECRWGGATSRHYSVAEHSIWVAKFARELVGEEDRDLATLHALLHDAHEAYIKDVPTPIKVLLGSTYTTMAAELDEAIRRKLGLPEPSPVILNVIEAADAYALWCEAKALLRDCPHVGEAGTEPPVKLTTKMQMIYGLTEQQLPRTIEASFLSYASFLLKRI